MSDSPSSILLAVSDRLYRLVLRLYPPGFRRAYGPEMAQMFRTSCRQMVRERGNRAVAGLWIHALADLASSSALEWIVVIRMHSPLRRAGHFLLRWGRMTVASLCVVALIGIATAARQDNTALPQMIATATPSSYQRAIAALQSKEVTPFTGRSTMSNLSAPESGIMPPKVTLDIGLRQTDAEWSVRDRTHYRVILHRVAPAIESGTITIVANGRTVTTYDDRTNRASVVRLQVPAHQAVPATGPSFSELAGWSRLLPPEVVPNPSQPRQLLERTILQSPYATTRMVGHAQMLGRRTDVFEMRPLYTFVWSTCKPPSRTGCAHPTMHQRGVGWGRLWIDHDHPFMLRDVEAGVPLRTRLAPQRYEFRVLSVSYGQGPSDQTLAYQPPVKPVNQDYWCLGCTWVGGWTFWPARQFQRFFDFPRPQVALRGRLPRMQVFDASDSPVARSSGVDILYSTGRHHDYYHPRDLQQIYALGPYVYIQQRIQRHGLPATSQQGTPHMAGACRTWSGSYHDGHHWLAFARGSISVFVYSNALSEEQLVQYAKDQLCSARPT